MNKKEKEDLRENTKKNKQKKPKKSIKENTKKKNIIVLVLAIIIIIIVIIKLLSSKNEKIMINKSVEIKIGGYDQMAMINYFTDNITINDNKYIVINIDIENKKNLDSNTSYHQFYLVDVNGNEVGPCYHDGMINNSEFSNIFPEVIKANSHTQGNLYCPTNNKYIKQFKIKVISSGSIDANNKVNYEYSDYYVDLKD